MSTRERRRDELRRYPSKLLDKRLMDLLQAERRSGPWEPWPSADPDQYELPLDEGDIDVIHDIQADRERDRTND